MAAKTFRKSNSVIAAAVATVQQPLAAWRQQRRPREPIPKGLWRKIVPLARVHGVSPIAQALRLNYTALKSRVVGGCVAAPAGDRASGFVEAPAAPWLVGPQYVLELEDRRGAKLTLRVARGGETEVLALAHGLWRHRL
jgi:hypothetical protein